MVCRRCTCSTGYGNGRGKSGGAVSGIFSGIHSFACSTRPWARKYVNAKMQRTNADSLIGENIRISERVSNMDQTGMAVVHGQEWTVRTRNDNEIIEPGEEAKILAISGVKLIVEKV